MECSKYLRYSNRCIIIDECGLYVVGYVENGQTVKYIAYSNKDICSINIIDYDTALSKVKKLKQLQKKLINNNQISELHEFYIISV